MTLESQLSPRAQRERWAPIHHTFPRCSAEIRLCDQLFILRADPSEIPRKSGKRPAGAGPPRARPTPPSTPPGPRAPVSARPASCAHPRRLLTLGGHAAMLSTASEGPRHQGGAPGGGTAQASPGRLPSPGACPADERQARGPQPVLEAHQTGSLTGPVGDEPLIRSQDVDSSRGEVGGQHSNPHKWRAGTQAEARSGRAGAGADATLGPSGPEAPCGEQSVSETGGRGCVCTCSCVSARVRALVCV